MPSNLNESAVNSNRRLSSGTKNLSQAHPGKVIFEEVLHPLLTIGVCLGTRSIGVGFKVQGVRRVSWTLGSTEIKRKAYLQTKLHQEHDHDRPIMLLVVVSSKNTSTVHTQPILRLCDQDNALSLAKQVQRGDKMLQQRRQLNFCWRIPSPALQGAIANRTASLRCHSASGSWQLEFRSQSYISISYRLLFDCKAPFLRWHTGSISATSTSQAKPTGRSLAPALS